MANPSRVTRFKALDMLRGLLALWVFSFHIQPLAVPWGPLPAWIASKGFFGVYIFFIVSGYAIPASMLYSRDCGESVWRFLLRRVRRVYLPLWLCLLVSFPVPYIMAALDRHYGWSTVYYNSHLDWSAWKWIRIASLIQVFYDHIDKLEFTSISAVLWTLTIEIQFYLLMALNFRWKPRAMWIVGGLTLLGWPFSYSIPVAMTGFLVQYMPAFGLGVAIFELDRRGITPARLGGWGLKMTLALLVLLLALFALTLDRERYTVALPLSSTVAGLMVWLLLDLKTAMNAWDQSRRWLLRGFARLLLFLGAMSYSIYLLHLPWHEVFLRVLREHLWYQPPVISRALFPLTILSSFLLFLPFYFICDRPFMHLPIKPAGGRVPAPTPEAPPVPRPETGRNTF